MTGPRTVGSEGAVRFLKYHEETLVQFAQPLAVLGWLVFAASAALAQSYSVKPIRLIMPQGPGGGSDLWWRGS